MTQRARRRHRRPRGSVGKKVLLGLGVVAVIAALGVGGVAAWVLDVRASAPELETLKPIDKGSLSEVLAADGSRLGFIQSDTNREPVDMDDIPVNLRQATIAIEDSEFRDHDGVDYGAVVRAAWENANAGFEARQGGSTVTQQLVRNLYIEDPEDTIERKVIEAKLAEELEQKRSKSWILREYLNTASYGTNEGRTAVGVEAASQVYFDKPVSEIDLRRAALLAGLPQAPSQYNPFQNPVEAKRRRNEVLEAMRDQGYISREVYERASGRPLGLDRGDRYTTIREPFFFDYVEQVLIEEYGVNTVRQGGLKVHTTIDPNLQQVATQAVENGAAGLGGPSAALVSTDVTNGHILAMASSSNYDTAKFNLAVQGARQTGSSFKPFVLLTALKQGIDPDSTYYDAAPTTLSLGAFSEPWEVSNAGDGSGGGAMSLAAATTSSVNVVYAKLGIDVGPESFVETAKSMGIESPLEGVPAEAIGGLAACCSVLEMSNAYATIAAGGIHHRPTAISTVEFPPKRLGDDWKVDDWDADEGTRAFTDGVAYEATQLLETVLTSGTAAGRGIGCPAGGKTGTTDDNTDAWFVGFTPRVSTAVWTGYPEARTSMGSSAFGGTYAAPIWQEFMNVAKGSFCGDFESPENPADLSAYSSEWTAAEPEPDDDYDADGTEDDDDEEDEDEEYDPDLYAPGAGQEPSPGPGQGGGGNQGGGGGGGQGGGGGGQGGGGN